MCHYQSVETSTAMSSHSNLTFATLCLLKLYVHIKTRNKRMSSNEKLAMETVKEHEVTSLLVRDSSPLQSITPSWRALLAAACPCNYFYISVCLWGTNCLDEVKFSLDVQSRSVSECLTGNSSFAPLFYIYMLQFSVTKLHSRSISSNTISY
jgi:hypothetical protein